MASNNINVGNESNDGKGQTLRDGFISVRKNIAEIFGITYTSDTQDLSGVQFSSDVVTEGATNKYLLTNSVTNEKMADDSVGAAELIDNSVGTDALNVEGDGDAGSVLKSDGDGSMSWINPADTLTEVLAIGNTTGGSDIAVSGDDNITFTDSSEAIFGSDADLKIYHDGTDAKIVNSTGNLIINSIPDAPIGSKGIKLQLDGATQISIISPGNPAQPNVRFHSYGAGTLVTNSSGNITATTALTGVTGDFSTSLTAPTFLGDLNGTINTATTGVTQNAGTNDTTIATTAYADAAAAAVPIADYLPLAGGALTGALTGTTATFAGNVNTGSILTIKGASPYVQWINAAGTRLGYIQHNATDLIYNADTGIHKFNQNATFSGNLQSGNFAIGGTPVSFGGGVSSILLKGTAANNRAGAIQFKDNDNDIASQIYVTNGGDNYGTVINTQLGDFKIKMGALSTAYNFRIQQNGNATFAGNTNISGSLGVGITTTPSAKLDVAGDVFINASANSNSLKVYRGTLQTLNLWNATNGAILSLSSDTVINSISLDSRANQDSYINTGGNVGIGTTSPDSILHIESTSNTNSSIFTIENDAAKQIELGVVRSIAGTNPNTSFLAYDNDFRFIAGAGSTNEVMRISSDGKILLNRSSYNFIGTNTSDSADNQRMILAGGGEASPARGAQVQLYGNEYTGQGGNAAIITGGTGAITFLTGSTIAERMRLTNTGDVLINATSRLNGYTSPFKTLNISAESGDNASIIELAGNRSANPGNQNAMIQFWNKTSTAIEVSRIASLQGSAVNSGDIQFSTSNAGTLSERMRITSAGNIEFKNGTLKVGDSTTAELLIIPSSDGFAPALLQFHKTDTATQTVLQFLQNNSQKGSITYSSTTTSYNETSDYRLKEDLQDFNGLDMISNIPVYDFKWKSEDSRAYGMMAHELQEVLPQAVSGEKDATEEYEITPAVLDEEGNVSEEAVIGTRNANQGVDYSKIVPLLVKSIQELKSEIELLKLNN